MTLKRTIRLTRIVAVALLAAGVSRVSFVQVVAPAENKDAKLRALEDKHLAALTAAAAEIAAHTLPARLYLTKEIVTGMQLIDGRFVLINGDRFGLDLQTAETVNLS